MWQTEKQRREACRHPQKPGIEASSSYLISRNCTVEVEALMNTTHRHRVAFRPLCALSLRQKDRSATFGGFEKMRQLKPHTSYVYRLTITFSLGILSKTHGKNDVLGCTRMSQGFRSQRAGCATTTQQSCRTPSGFLVSVGRTLLSNWAKRAVSATFSEPLSGSNNLQIVCVPQHAEGRRGGLQ